MRKGKHRIIICPMEISQFMRDIKLACDDMHIECDHFAFYEYRFGENKEYYSKQLTLYFKTVRIVRKLMSRKMLFAARLLQIIESLIVFAFFIRSIFLYDIYIYVYNRGMFETSHYLKYIKEFEFWVLKRIGKHIVFWCVGSDTRAPFCDGSYAQMNSDELYKETKQRAAQVRMTEKYGIMIDNPASAHFHTLPYVNCFSLGWPIYSRTIKRNAHEQNERIRIIHAPSNRVTKGSDEIKKIVDSLRDEFKIEYIELTDAKNSRVIKELCKADIAIDQLYSDTKCARFAAESSLCEVPVVVGSNMADELQREDYSRRPPTVVCYPDEIKDKIRELIQNSELRRSIGKQEREFIINHWEAKIIAKKIIDIAEGRIEKGSMVIPYDSGSIWGWGQKKEVTRKQVKTLVDKYGWNGLHLSTRSKVYKEYVDLIREMNESMKTE